MLLFYLMAMHNRLGTMGESLATTWLKKNGFIILSTNWRKGNKEIDVIATRNGYIHFIEVKTRSSESFGKPEDNVSKKKISRLIDAAEEYLFQNPGWNRVQFDILAINIFKDREEEYLYIEDIYL